MSREGKAWLTKRVHELDASVKRINARLRPAAPYGWETTRDQRIALECEVARLRERNAILEQMVDELQDEVADLKRQLKVAAAAAVVRYRGKGKKR
jgi:predicted  nucleic acid-binding Zn-ribbon protein